MLQACATAGTTGELGLEEFEEDTLPPWELRTEAEDEAARKAEAATAMAGMRGVVGAGRPGAEWVFRFWAQAGALTLLGFSRAAEGEGPRAEGNALAPGLETNLSTLLGAHSGEVRLCLRRQRTGWSLHSVSSTEASRPTEAKILPVHRTGVSAETLSQAHSVATRLAEGLRVPEGGHATFLADVRLDDDLLLDAVTVRFEAVGGPPVHAPGVMVKEEITQALLPFTHGVGPRTVRLRMEAVHSRGDTHALWQVVEAETLRPDLPAPSSSYEEHRALYERILREWREETRAAFLEAGTLSAEFLAAWFISGLAVRGGELLFDALAPRLAPILARGGAEAVGWLRSFLSRVRAPERERLHSLWLKGQTKGLTTAEQAQLRKLLADLERLLDTRLDAAACKELRRSAREHFYSRLHPELANTLVNAAGKRFPVHHRLPLEYAHLFPEADVNHRLYLRAVHWDVHEKINMAWTTFRPAGSKASARDVERAMEIIDRHFQRWYDIPYDAGAHPVLDGVEKTAIEEVRTLVAEIQKRRGA
jgi:hypothetical protein